MQTPSMTEITAIRIPIYKNHVHYNQSTYYGQVPVADGSYSYTVQLFNHLVQAVQKVLQ